MRPATEKRAVSVSEVDAVPAGHPVGFALLTRGDRQFVAYYDADRRLTVAQRARETEEWDQTWERTTLPERVGWDSHNGLAMAADAAGHLHLSGNMHGDPLVYFRTAEPMDASTFERVHSLVGRDEDAVTYPRFVDGPDGTLVFMYRDGGSGNGRRLLDAYDPATAAWERLCADPLLDGEGERNAYPQGPVRGPAGDYHLCWVWRETPDAATNHDVSYARSPDLRGWERSDGTPLDLPITLETGEIVDPADPGDGVRNDVLTLSVLPDGRPVLSYQRHDADGNTQVYDAFPDRGEWRRVQISDWDTRLSFGGRGSLDTDLRVDPVTAVGDGDRLVQPFWHADHGAGRWLLDPETLRPIRTQVPWHGFPADLRRPNGDSEGLQVQWAADAGRSGDGESADRDYYLRWETLPPNRDRPREDAPPPSTLRVYGFE